MKLVIQLRLFVTKTLNFILSVIDFELFFYHRYYMKARDVLNKYKHMPSFQGIHSDCEAIVLELMQCLRDQLRNPEVGSIQAKNCHIVNNVI